MFQIKLNIKPNIKPYIKNVIHIALFILIPAITFYTMESYEHNAFWDVYLTAQMLNILMFELIALFFFFLFGSARVALSVEIGIAMVYGLVNHYVMAFRSTPFVPWDIFSIETAASVVGNYDLTPTKEVIFATVVLVILFVAVQFLDVKFPYKLPIRLIPVLCVSFCLGGFTGMLQNDAWQSKWGLYPYLFTPAYMTKVNGMAVTFAMDLEYIFVEKPAGYNPEEVEEILKEYESTDVSMGGTNPEELPNIIVIMNEAFSDLAVLGDFTSSEDYMPFIHFLQEGYEDTITGMLDVSVVGGNTANSEFEFLTGHSMDFFPVGSIPYQQYIKGEIPNLTSHLLEMGYETHGMHPYGASGWNRDKVYPWFGFEHTYFIKDFRYRSYIRDYVSDKSAFNQIIYTYENMESDKPLFLFEVTMQNHGSYSDLHDNFTPYITVDGVRNNALQQYLSLVKETDIEFQRLIEYFETVEENTIVVFFGDHQPNDYVANQILRLSGKHTSKLTPEEALLRYKVPYVIWANYDIAEGSNKDMDINFLAANVLMYAGMETTPYHNFLLEYQAVLDADDGTEKYHKKIEEYQKLHQKLQYYFMYDYQED
ncbi:MAG: LTA synthase family protein [Lachnospiraceae bacterium]|nr:LTA synthase family protein [Lachnospiraceae bacterium]